MFISGSNDHLMPPKIRQSNAKHYKAAGTITEVKQFEGPHLLPSIEGWQEVADYALDWALGHAKTDDPDPAGPGSASRTSQSTASPRRSAGGS